MNAIFIWTPMSEFPRPHPVPGKNRFGLDTWIACLNNHAAASIDDVRVSAVPSIPVKAARSEVPPTTEIFFMTNQISTPGDPVSPTAPTVPSTPNHPSSPSDPPVHPVPEIPPSPNQPSPPGEPKSPTVPTIPSTPDQPSSPGDPAIPRIPTLRFSTGTLVMMN